MFLEKASCKNCLYSCFFILMVIRYIRNLRLFPGFIITLSLLVIDLVMIYSFTHSFIHSFIHSSTEMTVVMWLGPHLF